MPALGLVEVGAAGHPSGHRRDLAVIASPEGSDVIAEPAVPLPPALAGEAADLVEPARVPGLGDQAAVLKQRIGLDLPSLGWVFERLAVPPTGQDRRQVEAEP